MHKSNFENLSFILACHFVFCIRHSYVCSKYLAHSRLHIYHWCWWSKRFENGDIWLDNFCKMKHNHITQFLWSKGLIQFLFWCPVFSDTCRVAGNPRLQQINSTTEPKSVYVRVIIGLVYYASIQAPGSLLCSPFSMGI